MNFATFIFVALVTSACATTAPIASSKTSTVITSNPVLEYTGSISNWSLIGRTNTLVDSETGNISLIESDTMVTELFIDKGNWIAFYGSCAEMGDQVVVSVKANENPQNTIYEL